VEGHQFDLQLMGAFNVSNALAAIAVGRNAGLSWAQIAAGLHSVQTMPGRMELINEGQPFTVIVDYAPEPASMEKLYETVKLVEKKKVIHVLGSCGGGRDVARRPVLGRLAGENADIVIVTNEDPYDDDPQQIIDEVAAGAMEKGKVEPQNLFRISDRGEAIKKAISLAEPGDLVLVTGKGSEQAIAGPNGTYTPWDDREEVRRQLKVTS
jgi:UDP-N-acetylmuramyl tripeptide synthase